MSDEAACIRLRQALEMADLGFHLMRQSLHRKYPNATKAEIDKKFAKWIASTPMISGTDLKVIRRRRTRRPT